jgi:TolB-like protein
VAAVATAWLYVAPAPPDQDGAQAAAGLQLEGPAVVVAPFEDLSGSSAGRLFAGGLTQELITDLMRFKNLRVYAANSNERWAEDPVRFGEELQVAYQVKGSVLRPPDKIRLAVQLLELGSGRYVWSETYDRPLTTGSIFDIQEAMAAELAGRLAEPYGIVQEVSKELFRRHRPQTLAAYECVVRTFAYRRTFGRELYEPSRDCLEDTVRRDPSYLDAWAMLAYAHLDEYRWYGVGPLHRQQLALDQALAAAQRAKDLDPESVTSLSAYAAVQYYRGEFDQADSAQRRAVALNPNDPEALAQLGWRLAFARDWDQGIGLVRQAVQKSMVGSGWYYMILAFDDYRRGDYRATLADMGKAGNLGFFAGPAVVAMAQAQLGNQAEARAALQEAVALDATFATDPRGAYRLHHVPESLIDQFMAGLEKAGLKDPAV